jgi:hypothetical protein
MRGKIGRNHLNEEITPLLPSQRFSQTISPQYSELYFSVVLCRGPPGGRDKGQSPFGPQPPYGGGLGGGGGGWNPGKRFLCGCSSVANPVSGALFDPGIWQCCRSMTFWYGYGSADPCLCLMDLGPDSDPKKVFLLISF